MMSKIWLCFSWSLVARADWVELPKLQPEDFRDKTNKWAVVEGKWSDENISSVPGETSFKNKSCTSFEPNIESLLMSVHRALVDETKKSLPQKISYLKQLRNNILDQMWRRSQTLWDVQKGRADVSDFPSLEGALMTISVLTFAVFLVKIVSQFILGLQGANSTTMTVNGQTGTRFKRENGKMDADVIKMIEEFQIVHGN